MLQLVIAASILAFLSLIGVIIKKLIGLALIADVLLILLTAYLVIRIRIKMGKKEKETLRARIDELEKKIESIVKKPIP